MSDGKRPITTNALTLVALRLARPMFSMVLVVAISRLLGTEDFGRYTLALSFLFIFNELGPLGLSAWIAREGSRAPEQLTRSLASAVSLITLAAVALALVMSVLGVTLHYDPSTASAIVLLSLAIVPASINALLEGTFIARERMDYIAIAALCETAFKVIGSLLVLLTGHGLYGVLCVVTASYVVSNIISTALLHRLGVRVRFGWTGEIVRELIHVAPIFLLTSLFASLSWRVGIFLLSDMRSVEDVGQYGAAWRLLELALVFPQSLCLALYPKLAAARDDRATVARLGATAAHFLAAGAAPVAIILSLLAHPILVTIYGEQYADASSTLAVLIWCVVPYAWVRFNAYVLVAADQQRMDLVFNVAMTAINFVLNLILIPRYGALGTAIALLSAMTAHFLLQQAYLRRYLAGRAAPLRWDPAIVAAAVVLSVCVYLLRGSNLWSALAVGMTAYAAMLFGGGFFRRAADTLRQLAASPATVPRP